MAKTNPCAEARRLLAKHNVHRLPVPIDTIVAAEGAQVVRQRTHGPESGFTLRDATRQVIGVNSLPSPRRQRFSTAHELGHLVLHDRHLIISSMRLDLRNSGVPSMGTDQEEIEANQFAAELLIPRDMLRSAVTEKAIAGLSGRDEFIAGLARMFDVSTEAMGYALINLGFI